MLEAKSKRLPDDSPVGESLARIGAAMTDLANYAAEQADEEGDES